MRRLVTDRHGRPWEVRSRVDWRGRDHLPFEVDETDSRSAAVVATVLAVLGLVVLLATPDDLRFPGWAPGTLVTAALLGAAWWSLRRPWVVAAVDLERTDGRPWSRSVRGAWAAWRFHAAVAGSLASSGHPDPDALAVRHG